MPEEKNEEVVEVEETEADKERKEVVAKIQTILDEYGYALSVSGFIVVKK